MKTKRLLALFLLIVLSGSLMACDAPVAEDASAVGGTSVADSMQAAAAYVLSTVPAPQISSVGGEWAVIGLARSGYDVPQQYFDTYRETVETYTAECDGVLHSRKYTEFSRVALALTAIGADPTNIAGYDLLAPLADFDKTVWQGINGPIWALIALDSGDYPSELRQKYVDEILANQQPDGGWTLNGDTSNADLTAMALTALANYCDQEAVAESVDKGVACLSKLQSADGTFGGGDTADSETIAQTIVALTALEIDLEDERFVKNGNALLDALLRFQQEDGGFLHTADGTQSDLMSSEQCLYALAAASRAEQNLSNLYDMSDVERK